MKITFEPVIQASKKHWMLQILPTLIMNKDNAGAVDIYAGWLFFYITITISF